MKLLKYRAKQNWRNLNMKKFGKHIIMLFLLLVVAGCSFQESPEPDPVQEPPETMEVAVY
jgi:predicted component of type VI protein secretion system